MFLLDVVPPSPMEMMGYYILHGDLTLPLVAVGILVGIIITILIIKRR